MSGLRLVHADLAGDNRLVEDVDGRAVVDAEAPGVGDEARLDPRGRCRPHGADHRLVGRQAGEQAGGEVGRVREAEQRPEGGLELGAVDLARLERAQQAKRLGVAAKQVAHRLRLKPLGLAEPANAGQIEVVRTPPKSTMRAFAAMSRRRAGYCRDARWHRPRRRRGLVRGERRRGRAPARFRADLGRALEPHVRGRRRRGAPLGAAPATAGQAPRLRPRHGPRAHRDLGAPGHARPRAAGRRLLRGRVGERRPVLRDGIRRRPDPALPARGHRELFRRPAQGDRRARGRHPRGHPRRGSRRGRPRRAREEAGLRGPPATPLARAVGEVEDTASWSWSTTSTGACRRGSPSRAPRPSSTATTASTT